MAAKSTTPKSVKLKRAPEADIFSAAAEFERAKADEATALSKKKSAQNFVIEQLQKIRKVKSIESDKFGEFTRITVVQGEHVEYDENALWKSFTPAQRRAAFDANLNLNALSADVRKRVIESLTAEERKAVTTHVLNVSRMSQAVQADKIDGKVVAAHAEVVKHAPYISTSHGSGK